MTETPVIIVISADARERRRLSRMIEPLGPVKALIDAQQPIPAARAIVVGTAGFFSPDKDSPPVLRLRKGAPFQGKTLFPSDLSAPRLREALRNLWGEGGYDALCHEAVRFLEADRLEEAGETLELALSTSPGRPEAFYLAGRVLERSGSLFEAQENYATALVLDDRFVKAKKALQALAERQKKRDG
jgi:tetratricopeptide (TPR) repeat protein